MSTTRLYTLCYWALFLAVLANIDLGLNVAGIPVNIQRLVFLLVVACIIVGAGQLRLSRPALPFYCIAPLACYGALLALELFHNIRLQRFDAVVVVYFFTLLLIVVTCYLREYSAQKSHPTLVALVVAGVIATTGLSSLDFATITHSLSLDGDFYDSMRLRSTDTRNIINTWAAAVVIAFTFVSDLAWRDAWRRQRQAIVVMLALLVAVIVVLSASRAALALYLAALLFVSARETLHGGISGRLGVIVLWIALAIVTMTLLQDSAMMMRLTVLAGGDDGSAMQRLSAYVAVDSTLQQAFWLGHGQSLAEQAGSASENTFLAVVHRYGLIGLLIYSGFWLWLCRIGIQHFRELQFTASIAVTFLSLFTNDLLFFPLAIFVFAEVLRIDKQSGTDRVGVRPTVRRAWPA